MTSLLYRNVCHTENIEGNYNKWEKLTLQGLGSYYCTECWKRSNNTWMTKTNGESWWKNAVWVDIQFWYKTSNIENGEETRKKKKKANITNKETENDMK